MLWSRIACFTAKIFWAFRWQSTLNATHTWLQWDKFCADVRGKIIDNLTEMGYFTCPKKCFAWLKLALWSRIACFEALNLWHFRRQSTLNANQTWLQSTDHWAHIRGKIVQIVTFNGSLAYPTLLFAWLGFALCSSQIYNASLNLWDFRLQSTFKKARSTALNFWPFGWYSTLDVSQTWLH